MANCDLFYPPKTASLPHSSSCRPPGSAHFPWKTQVSLLEADCTTREEKTLSESLKAADWRTGKLGAQRQRLGTLWTELLLMLRRNGK